MRVRIRTRLTLVFAALMVAVLGIAGTLVYRGFEAQRDQTLNERLILLTRELVADFADGESTVLHDFGEGDSEGFIAQVLGPDGTIREQHDTEDDPLITAGEVAAGAEPVLIEKMVAQERTGDLHLARLCIMKATGDRRIVVGVPLQDRNAALTQLAMLLWLAGPALAIVASLLAWLLSGAALRSVENLRRQTSLISESDLAKRLPVPDTGDEIATLAATLNDMLARLEQAFERERRFVDDASHELRTPLGILTTELDLALRRSRTKEELEAALLSASEESERLNRLAEDLLVLARADRGKLPLKREKVNAEDLLKSTAIRFATKARELDVQLEVSAPASLTINVDAMRMRQAIGNLIINALAYTPRGGRIGVAALIDGPRELIVAVTDSGGGLPRELHYQRHRSRREGGAGLGLAIVKGVAEAHGGSATAANRATGGAVVTLRIPQ